VLANANPSLANIEQGVIHGGLQRFLYHLADIHTLTLKIEGDIEFQRVLNVKQKLEIL
jgi:hypothetical protein